MPATAASDTGRRGGAGGRHGPFRRRAEDDRLLPRGCLWPDQQLRRDRRRPAPARAPGGLRGRGVVRRPPRRARLRGAPGAPRRAARGAGGARPVLEGIHPRHGARVPQADPRPAGALHRAHLAGPRGRGALRGAAAARDLRRGGAGRDRRGQRGGLPGGAHQRRPVGPDHELQPGGAQGPGRAAGLLRLSGLGPDGLGRVSRRVPPHPRRDVGRLQRVRDGCRGASAGRPGVHPRVPMAQPLALPGGGRLRAPRATRADLASPGIRGPRHRRPVPAARRVRGAAGAPAVPLARQPRLGGREAHAAPDRRAGALVVPGHREHGPSARAALAAHEHARRGVPPPAGDPAAGGPGHHPRR